MDDDMIFDPSLKKKKKKKTGFDLEAALAGEQGESTSMETPADTGDVDAPEDDNLDLDNFGKKKKKKKKTFFNLGELENALPETPPTEEPEAQEDEVMDDLDLDIDFTKTKKKKRKKDKNVDELVTEEDVRGEDQENVEDEHGEWVGSDHDYSYDELLERVFDIMREKNPSMVSGKKQKFIMRPPQVVRIGTKKTSFANFTEICKTLHRQAKHLLDFLLAELGTSGSVDGNSQLIIKGRFQQKQIENVLRRYIKEYVTCHTCRSPDTILQKDTRLFFLQCETCGSRCSVASIKSGFQAVTGKRAAIRAKTA
ncbi:eukaryotic translation initiation factor 2 subunit 2 isoform X1 [Bombyx mandarina]|uniref:Eukaryotic translation initiation factor 2 subunit 2 n=2 Tax=Bombyx TaxID=7090 RepID=Q0ZB78_BOMMO|nr:eukaryotic translation initiation factor 2 subunit 2 [Bombyx mori]XP_028026508.1 eukaryotic translation initiation factor 2 subunit 2 isoform X1 [Bombyx mandarina]XP_028026509.1 eukaryotic translation initiation factor 2 subunit 2 isoform X2 [Bombyx mandarina]XP_028026510.1 eukaryotic translation initiation factor 2 subunit 2 isoform X1 [Bombyx mandarina]ABG54286.1 eukaryotic translation initiation factor 2 subunit 2 [Bombyx mori]